MEPLIAQDNDKVRSKLSTKKRSWSAIVGNSIIRFLLWSFFGYIVFLSVVDVQEGKSLFSWHPPLLTFSFLLMTESLMCFSADNVATNQLTFKSKLNVHFLLQVFAAIFALAGFLVVALHKFNLDKYHFTTFHGRFGLAGLLCIVVTSLFGSVAKYAIALRHLVRPANLKIAHAALGLLNYKLFVVTSMLGLYSSWFGKHGTSGGFYVSSATLLVIFQYVVLPPTRTMVARIRTVWGRTN